MYAQASTAVGRNKSEQSLKLTQLNGSVHNDSMEVKFVIGFSTEYAFIILSNIIRVVERHHCHQKFLCHHHLLM